MKREIDCAKTHKLQRNGNQKVRPEPFSFSWTMEYSCCAISALRWFAQSPTFPRLKYVEFSIGNPPIRSATPVEFTSRLAKCSKLHSLTTRSKAPLVSSASVNGAPRNSASLLTCPAGLDIISYLRKSTLSGLALLSFQYSSLEVVVPDGSSNVDPLAEQPERRAQLDEEPLADPVLEVPLGHEHVIGVTAHVDDA